MGAKGLKTRRRLIDATVDLLNSNPIRDIKVVDIAARANTASATFYLYFDSVIEVVCAASAELVQSTPAVMALFESEWTKDNSLEKAISLVKLYIHFWDGHRALLRTRNLAAEEGDERFVLVREDSVRALLMALADQITIAQQAGRAPSFSPAAATSGTIMMMLERLGALMHVHRVRSDITIDGMIAACAQQIATSVGFPPP
ncbi:TetR family transcriptional regulator [Sphingobium sp. Z007]|nr:TetR family transcriptional regulator [Sphingobium sp. Z007]